MNEPGVRKSMQQELLPAITRIWTFLFIVQLLQGYLICLCIVMYTNQHIQRLLLPLGYRGIGTPQLDLLSHGTCEDTSTFLPIFTGVCESPLHLLSSTMASYLLIFLLTPMFSNILWSDAPIFFAPPSWTAIFCISLQKLFNNESS